MDIDRIDAALGFEHAVLNDAMTAARHSELGGGYQASLVNFGFIAHAFFSTDDAIKAVG